MRAVQLLKTATASSESSRLQAVVLLNVHGTPPIITALAGETGKKIELFSSLPKGKEMAPFSPN